MQKKIPYITQEQYDAHYESFLNDERKDIGSSEIVLGDSHYQSPAKVIFEQILFIHLKASGVIPVKICSESSDGEDESSESLSKENEDTYPSVGVFLKKVLSQGCWYEETDHKSLQREDYFHLANLVVFLSNLLLG